MTSLFGVHDFFPTIFTLALDVIVCFVLNPQKMSVWKCKMKLYLHGPS